jgi:DNA-binding transcriptional MerR regulator
MNRHPFDKVWTRTETAEFLGCSVKTVIKFERTGLLQPIYISDRIIGYRDSNLRRFVFERTGAKHSA